MSERKAFPLRISPRLYAELEAWAAAELRSVNGQIEFLLTQAVRRRGKELTEDDASPIAPRTEGSDPGS